MGIAKALLSDQNFNNFAAKNLKIENLSSDPSGGDLYKGRIWFNSTTNLMKTYNGTAVVTLSASTVYPGRFVGSLDASGAAWPTSGSGASGAIVDGDMWQVSTAGTIGGVTLHALDLVIAKQDNATADAHFAVVEQERTDLSPYSREEVQSDIDFTANTEVTITASNLSSIRDAGLYRKITDGGPGQNETRYTKITEGVNVELDGTDPTIVYITSGTSLVDARVVLQGTSN